MGGGERKDIHLSLSPELLYKGGRLPPDLRQVFQSSPTKKALLARPGLLAPDPEIPGQPKHHRAGETVCLLCHLRPPLAVPSFPPSL